MSLFQQYNISWPDVYIQAELEKEPFADVHISTTRSEYFIKLQELAVDVLSNNKQELTDFNINQLVLEMGTNIKDIFVTEYAKVTDDGVFVCMDVESIDDDAMWKSLDMVYKAISNGGTWHDNNQLRYHIASYLH